jgi:hypothetical protein
MPIGKDETKEEFLKRLEYDHRLKERLFDGELSEDGSLLDPTLTEEETDQ